MGLTINFKPDLLETAIRQIGDRALKGMSGKMRKIAIRMRDLARDYAPVKTGLLEDSINYSAVKDGRRNAFVIYVDLDAARRSGDGTGVLGDYAYIMEERLHPYGRQMGGRRLTLGKLSAQKAASGKKVGGRFIARAYREATKNIEAELADEVRRVLGRPRLSDVAFQRERFGDDE